MNLTRRNFLKSTSLMAAGLGFSSLAQASVTKGTEQKEQINGRVNLAVIGVGMGCADLRGALTNPWVHCVGLCDVN